MRLVQGNQKIQTKAKATFPIIFGAPMDTLFIIKVKILVLIEWSNIPIPKSC
jgi:hypothetical protein